MLNVSTADQNCRFLAAPGTSTSGSQFGGHLAELGLALDRTWPLADLVQRGWLQPRLRVGLPESALQSWVNFPNHTMQLDGTCPHEQEWALAVWADATCGPAPPREEPLERLWAHWLEDDSDPTARFAIGAAVAPQQWPDAVRHQRNGRTMQPWIDYFAYWQAYHIAELLTRARFAGYFAPESKHVASHFDRHATRLEKSAATLADRWQELGTCFEWVGYYRTILAKCATNPDFDSKTRAAARAWATNHGITAEQLRTQIRESLLTLWQRWQDSPPISSDRLAHALQGDIQYATRLLSDLEDEPTDPFNPTWYWDTRRGRRSSACLIEALPHEEWLAQRDFPGDAVNYQRCFPPSSAVGQEQIAERVLAHWNHCAALRRFCLAWVRLHKEVNSRHQRRTADAEIASNERIEQFNLIALHAERLVRFSQPGSQDGETQPSSPGVFHDSAMRCIAAIAPGFHADQQKVRRILFEKTKLHRMPEASRAVLTPEAVAMGDPRVNRVVAAHGNALIARNYAAHHDYLDWELVYPGKGGDEPHAGATLMSSCLFVALEQLRAMGSQ